VYRCRCCGYSKVLKSRGLLILLKTTLVSDEGVYVIVARPKAICCGRTFAVNGRAFTFRHLVDCVTFGADFGRLQPAKQQCGCHGLKRRHSDLFFPRLAQSRRLYRPVSQGSAHTIRQASLGPSRAAPVFPSGAAGSRGPCVPIAFALGPLAVHRWLYHPKSARCFAPFTTLTRSRHRQNNSLRLL
jgi:hypothetical protein